jgi:hypothetical protein
MIEQKYSQFALYTSSMVQVTLTKVKQSTDGKLLRQNGFDQHAEMPCGSGFAIFS